MALLKYKNIEKIRALLIEWDSTGTRAGDINPKDPDLLCHGWQNMDIEPHIELRLVNDDRDLSEYIDTPGVTILEGKTAINKAIDDNFPAKLFVQDKLFFEEHVKELVSDKKIKISELPDNYDKRLKELKNKHNIKGVIERKPQKV